MANSPLLARLLNAPDLARIVPRLQPEILHRVIQTGGLEDCAELVALATPEQLGRVLDLDIWRVRTRGADEELDAERFGTWIAVLMESGPSVAAEKLAGLDIELVIAGFARHVGVFYHVAAASYLTLDGEHVGGREVPHGHACDIGGYVIEARLTSAWDAIVELLAYLDTEHPEYFQRLMRGCVALSSGPSEKNGFHDLLDDVGQDTFDLACDREARLERQGYVTPAQAQAFLRSARDTRLDAVQPPRSAIARAYFRAIDPPPAADPALPGDSGTLPVTSPAPDSEIEPDRVAAVVEMLREAGVLTPPPRALLDAGDRPPSRLSFIEAHVSSNPQSAEELAYLANAMVAGCSIQARPLTVREASDGAAAICNLGLENWPPNWGGPDLIAAFQVGWTVLHRDVCMYAAAGLIDVLETIRCTDRDIQLRLDGLRRALIQRVADGEPWRARGALDVILMLDGPAWAALLALIDECPVLHAALSTSRRPRRTVSPTEFEFISENGQIATVRAFMASLPSILTS
jgi:hypothetical protein